MSYFYVLNDDLNILMADDDPIMREFASVYLSTPTAKITTVRDGACALAELERQRFDILLLDLDMPVKSGYDVLESVRAEPELADLPVIVITGREDIGSIDRAYIQGATSFVVKPVNWRLLSYQIKYVLRTAAGPSSRPAIESVCLAPSAGDVK